MDSSHDQLLTYVRDQQQQGVPPEQIRQTLINTGWQPEQIDHVFAPQPGNNAPAQPSTDSLPSLSGDMFNQPASDPAYQQQHYQPQYQQQPASAYEQPQSYDNPHQPVQANTPQKYRVWQAVFDVFSAIKHNLVGITATTLIGYGFAIAMLGAIYFYIVASLGVLFFTAVLIGGAGGIASVLAGLVIAVAVWYSVVYSYVITITGLSLADGAEHRSTRIGHVFATSFKLLKRTIPANLILLAIFGLPYIVIMVFIFASRQDNPGIAFLLILAYTAWTIIAALRYALVPYIAIFEPNIPISKLLKRSHHLMIKGGQWFVFKGFLLYLVIAIALMATLNQSATSNTEPSRTSDILFGIASLILLVITNGVLVMLYRNRRAVRG